MITNHLDEAKRAARNIEHVGVLSEQEVHLGILHALIALSERDSAARLLAAETARVGEVTAQRDDAILYENEARDALARQTPHLLKVGAERDALAAKLDREARIADAARSLVATYLNGIDGRLADALPRFVGYVVAVDGGE